MKGLKVNAYPGEIGVWILPEGTPVKEFVSEGGEAPDGYHYGLADGVRLPVLEVKTADGRVFKAD